MDQEQLLLYETFGNYAVENLFWSLCYLNNAAFDTPMRTDTRNKLLSMSKTYETIILSVYPDERGKRLSDAMAENHRLFIAYVEHLMAGSAQAGLMKQKWLQNGLKIAEMLHALNSYWKVPEWSAMIEHQADLLAAIATDTRNQQYQTFINTAPICTRIAVDMSRYMSGGIAHQEGNTEKTAPASHRTQERQ
jgi:hypothetical protein